MSGGAGSRLPVPVLVLAGISTFIAVLISATSIWLQLKNYRKPILQRMVVRIMVMVPIYAVSSFISLFSLEAAFFIDAVRDIYEAFVIYCFFVLLLSYLGGERSLLILLHGRPPKVPPFPANIFKRELDVSDPHTFLFLKRGILQYVQVKPVLAIATMVLKATGKYNEGNLAAGSGYLYVSIIYNVSICLSLYCLAMFWLCVNEDLKPFRPVPKFLCVKGILFFSFWQSIGISILVAAGAIKKLGPYTDSESISIGLTDTLICIEMPFFAIAHMFAFSHTDFIDRDKTFIGRMPVWHAFKDAFGSVDVVEDTKATLRGEGMDYRDFEPSEGIMHQGLGRERRIRAGLRYSAGGKRKYWLPKLDAPGPVEQGVHNAVNKIVGGHRDDELYAPLLENQEEDVVHEAPDMRQRGDELEDAWTSGRVREEGFELSFGDLDDEDERLFLHCKNYVFGDYNYPCIDASTEHAKLLIWDEEERVLRDEHGAWFSPIRGSKGQLAIQQRSSPAWEGYGAVGTSQRRSGSRAHHLGSQPGSSERIIDLETERRSQIESGPADVRLQWTKKNGSRTSISSGQGRGSRSTTHSQSPNVRSPLGRAIATSSRASPSASPGSSGSNSSSADSPRHIHTAKAKAASPPSVSRNNSKGSSSSVSSSILPPDAVDLVVPDKDADDRKPGSSKLRQVYRRGFVGHDDQGRVEQGEVEVEGHGEERVERGEHILGAIESEDEDVEEVAEEVASGRGTGATAIPDKEVATGVAGLQEVVVARQVTPPSHSRHFPDSLDEGNPWA
ncbi:hypothetical protein D9758_008638 [Tetrapyrgos nigripes]|uniref:DUF300-domain-containing protein n=1 Tax=Tetrapyrgos nigripes TaxID=182062 RepID=A0A8H5FYT5_9AGAR|nr:hypothetical protein D9758_008638 [Tetrapyrgos nigripes]